MKKFIAGTATVLVLAVGALAYLTIGWDRMDQACSASPPNSADRSDAVSYSFTTGGFTCTYGNGDTRSAWWF